MKKNLPNCEKAYVPYDKLSNYLLSETHVIGRTKAKYFRSIGYAAKNAGDLAEVLLLIARSEAVHQEIVSDFGTKYVIDGALVTAIGTSVRLRTVWVIEPQDTRPRFVTAYPV